MKKLNIGIFSAFLALTVFFACKKEPNVAPEQDKELQTSVDASWASFLVSDVEMICSVMGEDASGSRCQFYEPSPVSQGTVTVIRNVFTNRLSYTFNNTTCKDGHVRDGSVWMYFKELAYAPTGTITGNENYTRNYNFGGRITLEEYKVDGWLVDNKDFENSNPLTNNSTVTLKSLRTDPNNFLGDLKWTFSGAFTIKKNQDSLAWKGTLQKTLVNTSDPLVVNPDGNSAIQWSLATVSYTGEAKGTTPGNVPFNMKYYAKYPLTRNFLCYSDPVNGVTMGSPANPTLTPMQMEFHPFVSGVASFTTSTKYPREIYFDNQQIKYGGEESPVSLPPQCDNKGVVQIKGIFYPVDFKY